MRARGFDVWTIFCWWGGSDPTDVNTLLRYDEWSAGSPSEFRLFPGFPLAFGLFFFFFVALARRNRARRVGLALNTVPNARVTAAAVHAESRDRRRRCTLYYFIFFYYRRRLRIACVAILCCVAL